MVKNGETSQVQDNTHTYPLQYFILNNINV